MAISDAQFYLATSFTDRTGAVDLMDEIDDDNHTKVMAEGFKAPPGTDSSGLRTVTIVLKFRGATSAALAGRRRAVQKMLDRAVLSAGDPRGQWLGPPVLLWVRQYAGDTFSYFDVRGGVLTEQKRDYGQYPQQRWILTLACAPAVLGAPIAYTVSGTITNGAAGTFTLTGIPGDGRALVHLSITDLSTAGAANEIIVGVRSHEDLRSGDFHPVLLSQIDAVDAPSAANVNDTDAMTGASTPRITLGAAWNGVCVVPGGTGIFDYGEVDVYARVKSSATVLASPYNVAVTYDYTGSWPAASFGSTYYFAVTALDGSSNETAASDTLTLTGVSPNAKFFVSWQEAGTATSFKVYVRDPTNGWGHKNFASSPQTLSSNAGFTFDGVAPPATSASVLFPPIVRAKLAVNAVGATWTPPREPEALTYGGVFEKVYLGRFVVPPTPVQEAGSYLPFKFLIEAMSGSSATPTLECDGLFLIPTEETQQRVFWDSGVNATKFRYEFDTRRDGVATCVVYDPGSGALKDTLDAHGVMTVSHGGAIFVFLVTRENGVVDVVHTKFSVAVTIIPTFADLAGVTS